MTISQTQETIILNGIAFPSQFLLDRQFPSLPDGIKSRYYNPQNEQFFQSDGQNQQSAGRIPWKEGETFLLQAGQFWEEFKAQENVPPTNTPSPLSEAIAYNPDLFLLQALQSELYQLGKNSEGQARREFEEVREIVNGRLLWMPEAIAGGGLLQKNLRELVAALVDAPESAIAEFNGLLKDDLGVDWKI